jgi:hypothetical protein
MVWASVASGCAVLLLLLWLTCPRTIEKRVEVPVEVPVEKVVVKQVERKLSQDSRPLARVPKVRVEVVIPDDIKDLVHQDVLQTRAELKLRSLGIPVASKDEDPLAATLSVVINGVWIPEKLGYAYTSSADLWDVIERTRLGETQLFPGIVWHASFPCFAGKLKVTEMVEMSVTQLTEKFANEYLAANPKK